MPFQSFLIFCLPKKKKIRTEPKFTFSFPFSFHVWISEIVKEREGKPKLGQIPVEQNGNFFAFEKREGEGTDFKRKHNLFFVQGPCYKN